MAALRSRYRHGGRWWTVGTTLALLTIFMVFFVAASGANLSGSTFEGNDGNLVVNTSGNADWANAPNRTRTDETAIGSNDNSFGQGTKEDGSAVSVVTGSIPPNKSDLSRFYTGFEKTGAGVTFLYLAWERLNTLGSANMDFELNQVSTSFPTTGNVTINRTAGDLLITYDFANGGASPSLGLLTWLTAGHGDSVSDCFSSNALPCWGKRVDLTAAGKSEGAINVSTVTDPIANVSLAGSTFGEAAINLNAALPSIFNSNPTSCESFGSAFLKSRSSTSFSAEVKDFVAPQPISVSNCGYVLVRKTASDTGLGQAGATFNISPGQTLVPGQTHSSDTVPGVAGQAGWYCIDNVLLGQTYTVTETAAPAGYDLASPTSKTASPTAGSCTGVNYATATTTATFSDPPLLGYVLVRKTAADTGGLLPGAVFSIAPGKINGSGSNASDTVPGVTSHDGYYCVDNLRMTNKYTVTETAPPSGYGLPAQTSQGNLSPTLGSCSSVSYSPAPAGAATFSDPVSLGYVLIRKLAGDTSALQGGASFSIAPGKLNGATSNTSDLLTAVANHAGYYCIDGLRLSGATYAVTETGAPQGYDIPSPATKSGLSATAGTCAGVSYSPLPSGTWTFTDPVSLGYVLVHKTAGDTGGDQAGATFSISPGKVNGATDNTSDNVPGVATHDGYYCVDGLRLSGSFTVAETVAPAGYSLPSPASHTSVTARSGSCANVTYSDAASSTSFTDPLRLGYVLIHKTAGDSGFGQPGASFTIAPGKVTSLGTNPIDAVGGVDGHDGYYCIDNLRLATSSFQVTETAAPGGYDIPSPAAHTVTASAGSCANATYSDAASSTSYVDPLKLGYVLVHKIAGDSLADQAGASFKIEPGQVNGGGAHAFDNLVAVSGHPGYYCIDTLRLSTASFTITETGAPTGYDLASPAFKSVSATSGSCANATYSDGASSASFTDPLKVGYVLVHKTAGDTHLDQAGATFTISPGQVNGASANASGTLVPVSGHPGWYCLDSLRLTTTSFMVTETAAPAGYDIQSPATTGPFTPTSGTCAGISFASPPAATVSYVDPLAVGAIVITKTGKDKSCTAAGGTCSDVSTRLLAGAVFTLKDANGNVQYTSGQTGANGTICISNIVPGTYTLHEKTAPDGYAAADDSSVTIFGDSTCGGTGPAAPTLASVVDQPLTTITVSTTPLNAGTTQSTVKCTGESDAAATPHTTGTYVPGTYTCTVVIDP